VDGFEGDGGIALNRLLNPRALGLAAVGLVLIAAMGWLGLWQFRVYDDHQRADAEAALAEPPVPLDSLLGPDDAFPPAGVSRPVLASGRYLVDDQIYVRNLPGSPGRYAVVTPLLTGSGSAILVVRGAADLPAAPVPTGQVAVSGVLEPGTGSGRRPDAAGVTGSLGIASLIDTVAPDLYSGYLLLRSSDPTQSPRLAPVVAPLPDASRWAGLRNLLYACQWWLFAVFVAFMWWQMTARVDADRPRAA